MTLEAMTAFFARRAAAFAARDVEALSADYATDCVVESPTAGTVLGRAHVQMLFETWFRSFPDLKFHFEDLIVFGDRVALGAKLEGTDTGGFLGLPPTGKPIRLRSVFLYTIQDRQILHERRVLDFSGVLLQLAGEFGAAVESARLYREMLESARAKHELETAAEIQRALLPDRRYEGAGFEVVATSVPCRAIGGDFFDYFALSNNTFGFLLGDVAGKGPAAALLASALQGSFSVTARDGVTPATTMKLVNDALVRRAIESRFATVIYAVLSTDGRLTYCNAGHNPAILIGTRGVRRLEVGGLIVGAFGEATFEGETLQLDKGDVLVMFSDGVTEALSEEGEELGEGRLLSCLKQYRELAPAVLLERTLNMVHAFTAGAVQSDDLTVLILRYTGLTSKAAA
jgi:steroid delta-isomerase-like uncharacterized protein